MNALYLNVYKFFVSMLIFLNLNKKTNVPKHTSSFVFSTLVIRGLSPITMPAFRK